MLEGSLREFSLADVFQLLTLTKKSGTLRVSSADSEGEVHFRGGEVFFATSDARRLQLGARLVAAGALDADTLRELLADERGGDALLVTKALMDAGAVDESTLDAFLREQIQDAVFTLVSREEGHFRFESIEDQAVVLEVAVATDQLVDEAGRRQGEWAAVREAVPSTGAVVAMAPRPADDEVSLSAQEWSVLTLVNGQRTVAELVDLTGKGEFATCTLLAKLARSGLVEIADDPLETALAQLVSAREALRALEQVGGPAPARPAAVELPDPAPVLEEPEPEPVAETPEPDPVTEAPEPEPAPEPQPEPEPAPEPQPEPQPAARGNVDRAQVARELAALGLDEDLTVPAKPRPVAKPSTNGSKPADEPAAPGAPAASGTFTRDEAVTKALLGRLIDGVKGV